MIYGYELIVDLKGCSGINRKSLHGFVVTICNAIGMKRYGKCKIVYFGKGRFLGFSLMQFITTSSIVGHFTKTEAYINIFSCKKFDKYEALYIIKNIFNTKHIKSKFIKRGK